MRRPAALALASAALVAAGCGSSREPATPVACLGSAGSYEKALAAAPGPVRLGGDTPISSCLIKAQAGGELATMGESMVGAATSLNAQARNSPGGDANVQLGYLVGAVTRGASNSGGIHTDLLRRLTAAAEFTSGGGSPPAAFQRAYAKGYAAGQTNG